MGYENPARLRGVSRDLCEGQVLQISHRIIKAISTNCLSRKNPSFFSSYIGKHNSHIE